MDACEHKNILVVSGDCRDMGFVRFPDGTRHEGYIPSGLGVSDLMGIEVKICVDCKQAQGIPDADAIEKVRLRVLEEGG